MVDQQHEVWRDRSWQVEEVRRWRDGGGGGGEMLRPKPRRAGPPLLRLGYPTPPRAPSTTSSRPAPDPLPSATLCRPEPLTTSDAALCSARPTPPRAVARELYSAQPPPSSHHHPEFPRQSLTSPPPQALCSVGARCTGFAPRHGDLREHLCGGRHSTSRPDWIYVGRLKKWGDGEIEA